MLMQPKTAVNERMLVVMTPHNQTIRRAFADAFTAHMKAEHGMDVGIDWRVPGGTSEVRKLMDSEFAAARKHGLPGIGVDIFFGGGAYDFNKQAEKGQLAPTRIFQDQPDLFRDGTVPGRFTGEPYYDPQGLWAGACLSSFGIVYNREVCEAIGLETMPEHWDDLADPRLAGRIALADPTKSGSVNKAFEMLIQEKMQAALDAVPSDVINADRARTAAKLEGWAAGLRLIQRIGANARYFTDSSTQIPLDVFQGNAAAGMCIDFYGRTYSERSKLPDGTSRVVFVAPAGGTSVSVDPVARLRGGPNPELAEAFIAFLMSPDGQRLWNLKAGDPGAPPNPLRRLPVRRDVYEPGDLVRYSDPDALPYEKAGFTYRPELTADAFNALALIVRAMCLDPHEELKEAWREIVAHGFPRQAMNAFSDVSIVSYENAMGSIRTALKSGDRLAMAELQARLGDTFRENYRRAASLARSGM